VAKQMSKVTIMVEGGLADALPLIAAAQKMLAEAGLEGLVAVSEVAA
jgi:hypothetical protein